MTDPEPSDSGHPLPVNRIALLSEYGLLETVGAPPPAAAPGAAGQVVDLESPPGMIDIVPPLTRATRPEYDLPSLSRGPFYHSCYTHVRNEIRSGRAAEEIRADLLSFLLSFAEVSDETTDLVRQALEDALAGRPPKYEGSPEP